jgi:hypothetical protein
VIEDVIVHDVGQTTALVGDNRHYNAPFWNDRQVAAHTGHIAAVVEDRVAAGMAPNVPSNRITATLVLRNDLVWSKYSNALRDHGLL